ncbi:MULTISPECIES: nitrilase-related carbon-nitrogen hydrolase [Desulfococcus]|jgi:N-carbamoylputrescine amidase|uniref:Nitrilase/cyanide hydratase and apolipoprotein N-acyltransferase n=1 Tax=Desulfococcus multivorans DSM 2059 TaxID=1121405 RepID=S7UPB5_DESML|nr:nitrilase-related carbon-nitrogen hydrolase [Desulfococcus multivorans]AOY59833.1 nitrilase/cyanide hydratase and apolipoprotein N-acyltransferase [Desulfococcus multivorans]AQV01998.1 nitrilase [Desulfococcus multivorans]EPR35834.1 Nitrilase/cyanide hydratase and apolipoprotein N-acyltransferase [Desulfococcus multivorans DSM 2059]MDX9819646.1 nitrilase-related carbon-nitrogen hydrolase [Desulfococcus multivorans]SJZ33898.1 N-carbamoylputrescine amidase [Desulfococcus multivorans DSM 2059]
MKDIRIAAAIFHSAAPDIQKNMERMTEMVLAARSRGAHLICFPEMNICGYSSRPDIKTVAETVPGPVSEAISRLARREDIVILAGMAEKGDRGALFVSHLAAFPDGGLGVYRKVHIAPPEQGVFTPGNAVPVFELAEIRFGIQLCYDAHFPDLSTLMAQKGADVIFMPHASPRGTPEEKYRSWRRHLPARAFDNSLFVIACNQAGENSNGLYFPGIALAIDPSGNIIGKDLSGREGMLLADLSAAAMERVRGHKMRFFLPNRRQGLYERARGGD